MTSDINEKIQMKTIIGRVGLGGIHPIMVLLSMEMGTT